MTNIEIPLKHEKTLRYRLFEILPGFLSWSILILPFVLSIFIPTIVALIIIAFFLLWFARAVGLNVRVLQGWRMMTKQQKLDWVKMLEELDELDPKGYSKELPKWHYKTIERLQQAPPDVMPRDIVHAVIVATYNESRDVLEPTIQSVIDSEYDVKGKVILVLAYEERGGEEVENQAQKLMSDYRGKFKDAFAVKHPKDLPNEVIGKGGNITYAARELRKYIEQKRLEPKNVLVTTLDADNRPHKKYLAALSYIYTASPDRKHASYQPVPMFTNNIWDAPAPMRVIATGNSFWNLVLSLRPHMLRNFSSHAQPMDALIETDFWSVRTIVEDGHQFWRSYFRFEGQYEVHPLYLPIYQDAVLTDTYRKTLKAQFVQLRRWAYGASDVAYVAQKAFFTPNKIPKVDKLFKFLRLLEGHVSWATAPLILAFAAFIPLWFNPDNYTANQLPIIASRIQTLALAGILITFFLSVKTLPPKPLRYKRRRSLLMAIQWVLLPVTTILYNALAALYSQTRLMIGKYLDKFDVTEKSVRK